MWSKAPISLQCNEKKFTKFISSPLCSHSLRRHRSNEVKNYVMSLEVEGKVSVLMGLASASIKYRHKDESSSAREVISLSCSVYARKGFLIPHKETPKYSDNGVDFNVEGMEIGMEDILIVTSEYERDDKKTENTTEFKARVLFFSISGKLQSIYENSEFKGFVRIDHYSSSSREWKSMEFDGNSYGQALDEVKRIEAHMCDIPYIVSRSNSDTLPHLRMVVTPCVGEGGKIALYLELQSRMNAIQASMVGISESTDDFCNSEVDRLEQLLAELKGIDIGNSTWEFLESLTGTE